MGSDSRLEGSPTDRLLQWVRFTLGALGVVKVTSTRLRQAYTLPAQAMICAMGRPLAMTYSILANLLRPTNERDAVRQQPVLLPRTAADELPPYREQPWIIDRRGYRKVDPSMTLVPVNRL